jgi:CBS domain containing-hemolysin-like protein
MKEISLMDNTSFLSIFLNVYSDPKIISFMITMLSLEAFFSGSEMALIAADRLALKRSATAGSTGAKLALKLLQSPESLLTTLLIGTNICVITLGAAMTIHVQRYYGTETSIAAVGVLTPMVLIFGELLPKTIFQRFSTSIAPIISYPVWAAKITFYPFSLVLSKYGSWLSKALRPVDELLTGKHRSSRRDVLNYLLTGGKRETLIPNFESTLIHRILSFSRAQAKNALIPLVNVDAIEEKTTIKDALDTFSKTRHSRLPVYRDRVDNIIGIVHVFDAFLEKRIERSIGTITKDASYFPETQKVQDILFTMQSEGIQMGVVVDEYGGAVGVLTLEDLIEEIVGDISDEYDSDKQLYKELGENQWLVQARMEVENCNEALKIHLPQGQYETVGGFLLQQFNRIPDEGDELYYGDLKFVVQSANNRVIQSVRIIRLPTNPAQ